MTTEQCYMLGGVLKAQESDHVTDNSTRLPSDGADRVLKEGKVLEITKDKQNDELEEIRGVLGREALRALEQRAERWLRDTTGNQQESSVRASRSAAGLGQTRGRSSPPRW